MQEINMHIDTTFNGVQLEMGELDLRRGLPGGVSCQKGVYLLRQAAQVDPTQEVRGDQQLESDPGVRRGGALYRCQCRGSGAGGRQGGGAPGVGGHSGR